MKFEALELNQYPVAIATAQLSLVRLQRQAKAERDVMTTIEGVINRDVAFDKELKNDTMRKAKREEMLAVYEDYQVARVSLEGLETRIEEAEIYLNFLRCSFSVAKLAAREAIAELEAQAAA